MGCWWALACQDPIRLGLRPRPNSRLTLQWLSQTGMNNGHFSFEKTRAVLPSCSSPSTSRFIATTSCFQQSPLTFVDCNSIGLMTFMESFWIELHRVCISYIDWRRWIRILTESKFQCVGSPTIFRCWAPHSLLLWFTLYSSLLVCDLLICLCVVAQFTVELLHVMEIVVSFGRMNEHSNILAKNLMQRGVWCSIKKFRCRAVFLMQCVEEKDARWRWR